MNVKFLVVGALVAGIVIFLWGTVSHVVLPWHKYTMDEFTDSGAVLDEIAANTKGNGVYFGEQGVFAIVSVLPDRSDKTVDIGGNLVKQFVIDVVVGLLLAAFIIRSRSVSILGRAAYLAAIGLAGGIAIHVAHWNWYGFSTSYTVVNVLDLVITWFLAGLVLAALAKKMAPSR